MIGRRLLAAIALLLAVFGGRWVYAARFDDQALHVDATVLARLDALRREPKFADLPGVPGPRLEAERARNTANLDGLLDNLRAGIAAHPGKRWVFEQMEPAIDRMHLEDTEARERFIDYLVRVDDLLGIAGTHGAFAQYLIFF